MKQLSIFDAQILDPTPSPQVKILKEATYRQLRNYVRDNNLAAEIRKTTTINYGDLSTKQLRDALLKIVK